MRKSGRLGWLIGIWVAKYLCVYGVNLRLTAFDGERHFF